MEDLVPVYQQLIHLSFPQLVSVLPALLMLEQLALWTEKEDAPAKVFYYGTLQNLFVRASAVV